MSRQLIEALACRFGGELTGGSDVEEVHGIGPHLAARLAVAMRRQGRVTIDQLWRFTRNMDGPRAERFLLRALQNARGNQCVRPGRAGRATYHTGDVNVRAYEALAAVLAFRANAPYAAALREPARPPPTPRSGTSHSGCGLGK